MTNKLKIPKLRFSEFSGEWEEKKLGEVATFSKGKGLSKSDISIDGKNKCIRYGELYTTYGETINNIKSYTNLDIDNSILSEKNDIIIPASGETQIDIATASCVLKDGIILGGDLNIIKSNNNGVFLSYYLNSKKKNDIAKLSQGVSVVHLYNSQLQILKLNLPLLPEQEKIANFLSSVDKKIELLEEEKKSIEEYKKGIMQKIFSQELRFKDENGNDFGEWEEKKIGEFLIHKSQKNKLSHVDTVLSVSNKKGFISQSEQFDGYKIASKDLSNYKVVKKFEYAYNPSRINVGSIARLEKFDLGIVSPMYVVFGLSDKINSIFFDNLYKTHKFKHLIKVGCSGSVRDSLNFNDLSNFTFLIPTIEEQEKIADFLSKIDKKIELIDSKLEKTKSYKKGLLQDMFV